MDLRVIAEVVVDVRPEDPHVGLGPAADVEFGLDALFGIQSLISPHRSSM